MLRPASIFCLLSLVACPAVASVNTLTVAEGAPLVKLAGFGPAGSFNSLQAAVYGSTQAAGSFTLGDGQWSGTGVVMNNHGQGSDGLYATPANDAKNYMAVLGGAAETVAFSTLKSGLAFYWGSMDWYNSVTLYNGAQSVTIYAPAPANGDQFSGVTNSFMEITGFDFSRIVFASKFNSFEFDNVMTSNAPALATAVPEPSTWAMLLAGFAVAGYRRRAAPPRGQPGLDETPFSRRIAAVAAAGPRHSQGSTGR
jgi:hypothetical protein